MSLRIIALFLLSISMMFVAGISTSLPGSSHPARCGQPAVPRTLQLTVPANRAMSFPFAEFDARGEGTARAVQAVLGQAGSDDALRFASAAESETGSARVTPWGILFEPAPGFIGVSAGWVMALFATAATPEIGGLLCAEDADDLVLVTFEVRNTLPIAVDDAVTVPAVARTMDVGPESGVLANDLDWNGDPLVVHGAGVTTFPWGAVHLSGNGSFRVEITNRDALSPATVRYVVWDQQGSPTSVDIGHLDIDFSTD